MFSITTKAQDLSQLPSPDRCVSQDMQVIGATLTGTGCVTCTPGDPLSSELVMTIYNATNSLRTAFAFYGTLVVKKPDGTIRTSRTISDCNDDGFPGREQRSFTVEGNEISYFCGDQITITGLYLAWTDASDGNRNQCPLDASKIAPKCGTLQELKITTPLTAIATGTNIACFGGNTGSATVIASGGTGPYTYSWSPSGGTGATASNLSAGTYVVTVTDAKGCKTTASYTVTQPATAVNAAITGTNVNCYGGNTGSATVTATGGTGPYTYSWSPSGGTGQTASNLTAGTYTVTVTDSKGCTTTASYTVTQPAAALSVSTIKTDVSCHGGSSGSATATASGGTGPYTYSWSTSPVQTGATASNLTAGTYTVTATDSKGCTKTATVTIGQPDAIVLSTSKTDATCSGSNTGSATVTATGGVGPYTYSWSPTGGTGATAANLAAGTYTVTVTDSKGCTKSATVTIAQPSGLTASVTKTNVLCYGGSTGSATVTASGGTSPYTYSWSPSGGTSATASNLTAGTYTVTVTDAKGCTTTATATIGQPTALSVSITTTGISCYGGTSSVTAVASGGTAPYTYSWNSVPVKTGSTVELPAGSYTLTVTDSKGCTKTAQITISQPYALSLVTTKTDVSCYGGNNGSATATASGGTGPYTYTWNTSPVQTGSTASNLAAGTYTVTATDSRGCIKTATVTIGQPLSALHVAVTGTDVNCYGGSTGTATVTASGGTAPYTYIWNTSPVQTGTTASNLPAGTYTVTVTDAKGCIKTGSYTVTQPASALMVATTKTDANCTGPNSGSATATATGGTAPYTYAWSPSGGTAATASNLAAGTYTVTVTDAKGCTKTASVVINPATNCVVFEGCTLGYWKNHTDRWCSSVTIPKPYYPNYTIQKSISASTLYGSIFADAPAELKNLTLLQVLNLGGGGIYNLARQSVAALLNICSPDVDYNSAYPSTVSLIKAVNTAYKTGGTAPGTLATKLDKYNNAGCPLGGTPATTSTASSVAAPDRNLGKVSDIVMSAYPNPFSESSTIDFTLREAGAYSLTLFDVNGKAVKEIRSGVAEAGVINSVTINGDLPAGIYIARLRTDSKTKILRIMLRR